jgi:hypothetical protein
LQSVICKGDYCNELGSWGMGFKVVIIMEHYMMNAMGAKVELNGIKKH